ncbi:MAG: diguanylate cyclase [Deltaproteobacteria bacterium]|nr:diguanylate cyclase [Deltaproteobacteria bacterium]
MVVDDEIDVRNVVAELLSSLGFNVDSENSGKSALQRIKNEKYTFLITDVNMPEFNGIELIKTVREEKIDISIIAMTGYDKDYAYMDVINAGANDFITKPFKLDEIEAKISRILIEKRIRDELAKLSITDNLTGLFNQRHFHNKLKDEVNRANRQNHPLSLILLDLDKFKEYNDTYGHLAGDKMLAKSGKIILSNIRENVDMAFRYGGDEFAIILVEANKEIVLNTSERLIKGFEEGDGVTASVGFATYSDKMTVSDFISLADKYLYESKNNA